LGLIIDLACQTELVGIAHCLLDLLRSAVEV